MNRVSGLLALLCVCVSSAALAQRKELTPATPEATCELTPALRLTMLGGGSFDLKEPALYFFSRSRSQVQVLVSQPEGATEPRLEAVGFWHLKSECLISVDAKGVQYGSKLDCEDAEIEAKVKGSEVTIQTPEKDVFKVTLPSKESASLGLRITLVAEGNFRRVWGSLCGEYKNPPATVPGKADELRQLKRHSTLSQDYKTGTNSIFHMVGEAQKRARGE
ncbi:hypothetical protein FJV41_22805 [Myxococcus llanfairpwllgwyngyllgogerychwyrndrobwllllantysiliogogogochensis]|uniref:Lipoprotein n=1 Tax=Myxococcus llanfairpwllgwyngyllgogerychwyrndrobwllllantysiliogogogochensis TaxID=2590453 RepID=A0A540WXB1_9BACT|nr:MULTISPECIES: hypothetical protein [Myxococcus]NTX50607.1 hypothetical protein [Myxococcus sp. CA039A]TQF13639.1 hypothetical protein FJV41_22805 [Myxococcus llanfairpwllgwyngyllgogerychwyrndrobwllllantysiliogogogochensis]